MFEEIHLYRIRLLQKMNWTSYDFWWWNVLRKARASQDGVRGLKGLSLHPRLRHLPGGERIQRLDKRRSNAAQLEAQPGRQHHEVSHSHHRKLLWCLSLVPLS